MPLKKTGIHWFLTDEEVKDMREQLDVLHAQGNYEPGKWFLSGLNQKPEVLGSALPDHMPKKVILRDITMRTAEQACGVILTSAERIRLLRALVEVGVTSFQLTMAARYHGAEQLGEEIKAIKSLNPEAEIEIGGVADREGIDRMVDRGANCFSIQGLACYLVIPLYIAEIRRLAWEGKDWRHMPNPPPKSVEEMAERNQAIIDYGHKRGVKVKTSLNMMHFATAEVIENFAREMAKAGADYISLHDGPGAMTPQAIGYAVTIAKKAAPKSTIGVHLHNTFSLGIARALAAVQAGAGMVECRLNGMDSLGGGVDLTTLAAALELLYRVDTGLRLDQFTALSRLGEDISRYTLEANHAITGSAYFTRSPEWEESVDPFIHATVNPSVFGNVWEKHVGQTIGAWGMLDKLTNLGIPVEKAEVEAIVKEVQGELLVRKRNLTDDEIRAIAMKVKGGS